MTAFRWGDPDSAIELPPSIRALLGSALGVTAPPPATPVALPPPASLPAELRADTSDEARLAHAAGMSTEDLLHARAGVAPGAPDGVVRPTSHEEVLDTLRIAAVHHVAVVPYGGGTSVVGGLHPERLPTHGTPTDSGEQAQGVGPFRGVVALDLGGLDRLVAVDRISRTATFEAGVRGPRAEEMLAEHGFTLGHFPQSFQYETLGGFAATRSSGQASAGFGRFDQMVVALRAATPTGSLELGRAPQSAAGPDLRQLLLGSEGAFGVITEVTLGVRPIREMAYEGWSFASFADGLHAVRALAQDGPLPVVLRLSDEPETAINAATAGAASDGGCLAIIGTFADPTTATGVANAEAVADAGAVANAEAVGAVGAVAGETGAGGGALAERLAALGGKPLGAAVGEHWRDGRFRAPYLRDALLDAGALAETLETATFWERVPATYEAVRDALVESLSAAGTPPIVMCHVSHVYATGASLYFTVVAAQAPDPVAQWRAAKAAAGDAIVRAGATITHHHGVGRDHRPWFAEEIGVVGVRMLRAVKDAVDPTGVLNPGILLP